MDALFRRGCLERAFRLCLRGRAKVLPMGAERLLLCGHRHPFGSYGNAAACALGPSVLETRSSLPLLWRFNGRNLARRLVRRQLSTSLPAFLSAPRSPPIQARRAWIRGMPLASACFRSAFVYIRRRAGLPTIGSDLASECSPQPLFSPRAQARKAGSSSKPDQE